MQLYTIYLFTFLLSLVSWASYQNIDDVPIVKKSEQVNYINIPSVTKNFESNEQTKSKKEVQHKCQEWVIKTVNTLEPQKVHHARCVYYADVILRKHVFTGEIILQSW